MATIKSELYEKEAELRKVVLFKEEIEDLVQTKEEKSNKISEELLLLSTVTEQNRAINEEIILSLVELDDLTV